MTNQTDIIFKTKKTTLIFGIVLLGIAAGVELMLVTNAIQKNSYNDTMFLIMGNIIIISVLVLMGVSSILTYRKDSKRIRTGLQKYGEENLIQHIQTSTISMYKEPMSGAKIYFTDKLVIDPGETIIDYNEISLMYKQVSTVNGIRHVYINFELYDGSIWSLCDHIEDAMIHNFMQLCFQHNPAILFGYTNENLAKHKERVAGFKNGNIKLPTLTLSSKEVNEHAE